MSYATRIFLPGRAHRPAAGNHSGGTRTGLPRPLDAVYVCPQCCEPQPTGRDLLEHARRCSELPFPPAPAQTCTDCGGTLPSHRPGCPRAEA